MRILMNENMPGTAIRVLRERGHDVLAAKDSLRGEPDERILARPQAEGRHVVTQARGSANWPSGPNYHRPAESFFSASRGKTPPKTVVESSTS